MNFPGAGATDYLDQLLAGVAPNQAVVHHDHRFSLDHFAHRIELDLHLGNPEGLGWIDEGPAHVVVSDQAVLELDAGHFRETQRHGIGAIRNTEHHFTTDG